MLFVGTGAGDILNGFDDNVDDDEATMSAAADLEDDGLGDGVPGWHCSEFESTIGWSSGDAWGDSGDAARAAGGVSGIIMSQVNHSHINVIQRKPPKFYSLPHC